MSQTELFFAFLLIFVRCSGMLLASPVFGAHNTPVQIRIFTALALAGSLALMLKPELGPMPNNILDLGVKILHEAMAGLLIGGVMNLALQAAAMAGSIMDFQTGLASGHVINPVDGQSSTLLSQFKFMLATIIFLGMNGHHTMIQAFVASYRVMPNFDAAVVQPSLINLLQATCLLAVQIATPVLGVSLVVDAAMGLVNRAVPQMPAMVIGMPAKIAVGLTTVAVGLPLLTSGVNSAVGFACDALVQMFK